MEKAYRGGKYLEQFRAGGELRGYCLFEDTVPGYNCFVFVWITEHEYDRHEISRFDAQAGQWATEIRAIGTESEAETFLNDYGAFDTDAVLEAMTRLDIDPPPDWHD